jgi:hypothetical protein
MAGSCDTVIKFFTHLKYGESLKGLSNYQKVIKALHGCETWFLSLREEQRLGEFGNRALKRIFQNKRNEVAEG